MSVTVRSTSPSLWDGGMEGEEEWKNAKLMKEAEEERRGVRGREGHMQAGGRSSHHLTNHPTTTTTHTNQRDRWGGRTDTAWVALALLHIKITQSPHTCYTSGVGRRGRTFLIKKCAKMCVCGIKRMEETA